jgi:16S rRNA (guanine527-N7)-methyltransferase
LSEDEACRFEKYMALLVDWNRVHRLIGSADPRWIVENVFLDSLLFLRVLPRDCRSLADLGSGAGIPGVPLKIVSPQMHLTMIEPRHRRVSFLSAVIRELPLVGAQLLPLRAEDLARQRGHQFEHVVMRCAGPLDDLIGLASRLVAPGGLVIASGSPKALGKAGTRVVVPGTSPKRSRTFIVYEKSH